MKVLFVCAQGLSSAIAVNALKKEAQRSGIDIEVLAVSTKEFEEEIKNEWNLAMVAPQVRHKFEQLKKKSNDNGVPCVLIESQAYSPLGGSKLLRQVQAVIG